MLNWKKLRTYYLIFGSLGLVGQDLVNYFSTNNEVYATYRVKKKTYYNPIIGV